MQPASSLSGLLRDGGGLACAALPGRPHRTLTAIVHSRPCWERLPSGAPGPQHPQLSAPAGSTLRVALTQPQSGSMQKGVHAP